MKLATLLSPWLNNVPDCIITGIHNDSRKIKPGFLFLAYKGNQTDGRFFIEKAIENGAVAIVYDPSNLPKEFQLAQNIPLIALPKVASILGDIANRFYKEPRANLNFIAVTGTNGKTTIAYQLAQAHQLLGKKSAYVGTIGQGLVNELKPLANTTPDALELHALFDSYASQKIKDICMEVSSHALCQDRVQGIEFEQAIFTNLTHEHLDYHETMEAYAAVKASLFAKPNLQYAIINYDDSYSDYMKAAVKGSCKVLTYGLKKGADIQAVSTEISLLGTKIYLNSPWGQFELFIKALGHFNVYNALAIFTSLAASEFSLPKIVEIMRELKPAPGRMEVVRKEPYAIVDYAHSPDALENVLSTLNQLKKQRMIVVFGCGGDRDKTKRPMMGKIANDYADIAILTNDNPRSEDPLSIIESISQGLSKEPSLIYKIADREEAIHKALSMADKNDIVVVAGKGHEDYQIIGGEKHHFSDREVILNWK